MTERRSDPRFSSPIKAYALGGPTAVLETSDISAGGAYFVGDPRVDVGSRFWLSLELAVNQRGHESVFPLAAEVRVVRRNEAPDGSTFGFGCQWLSVFCRGDVTPLKEFLRQTLSISAGFIQTASPPDAPMPAYAFVFPGAQEFLDVPEAAPPEDDALAASDRTPLPMARGTPVYVLVPVTWSTDEGEFEGRATKLLPHMVRVATAAGLPPAYRRVTLKIPVKQRDKPGVLGLGGTVLNVRKAVGGATEGQFEVQLTLGNDPEAVSLYRKLLEQLASSAGAKGG